MRKLKMLVAISLDGYAVAPDEGFDWITYNGEVERHAHDLTLGADVAVFGRRTYKGMQSYWPTVPGNPASSPTELGHANWLARSTKVVVSETLSRDDADWPETILMGGNFVAELTALKQRPGGDMVSFGSPGLVRSCVALGLFDELHININPVLLGGGRLLFQPQDRLAIVLVEARTLQGGVVALHYRPAA